MLLLDEPTNHLDAESVHWLEQYFEDYAGTVVAITHDRYFLDNAAGWILELDRGRGISYEGNYSNWLEQKKPVLPWKKRKPLCKTINLNLNGFVQMLRADTLKARHDCNASMSSAARIRVAVKLMKFIYPPVNDSVMRLSSIMSQNHTVIEP